MGFCEELTAWHFAAMCAAVNFAEPWISSYVGSAMCPECPGAVWQGKSCWLHPRERGPVVDYGPGGVTTSPTSRPQWLHLQGKATTKIGCIKCALGKVAACWLFPIPSPPEQHGACERSCCTLQHMEGGCDQRWFLTNSSFAGWCGWIGWCRYQDLEREVVERTHRCCLPGASAVWHNDQRKHQIWSRWRHWWRNNWRDQTSKRLWFHNEAARREWPVCVVKILRHKMWRNLMIVKSLQLFRWKSAEYCCL